jgi:hypothetical protein
MCDGAADVHIKNITHIFAYNGDDDEDVPSESTKTADVSGFKDFVVSQHLYTVNEKLKDVETVSGIFTDKMQITGELKIAGFNRVGKEDYVHGMYVDLPTDDEIYISASDNPLFELNNCAHPSFKDNPTVFIEEDETELRWHEDLAPGDFYIMFNETGGKRVVLIKWIHDDKIEYVVFNSEYNQNTHKYYFKENTYELRIEYAKDYKFVPVNDIK